MTSLLVMTAGQTDVQLVVGDQRQELEGRTCGKLHDVIEQRAWKLVDAPGKKMPERATTLPDGDLMLCTPKLDAVLSHFNNQLPNAAVIFETRREFDSDPHYAGTVLERRLRDKDIQRINRISFLDGKEWIEDSNCELDSVIRRTVIKILSTAIAAELTDVNLERVVLALTGGMPQATSVIDELVRLHAVGGPRVMSLEVPDSSFTRAKDRAIEERFQPAAGFRARWHALSLIEKGNLLGAWGAVSHLENEPGQNWTQVVKWLANFAASLPMPQGCDLPVLSHHRMAVRAAIRVELSLRAGDIPRAVHSTVAFLEAALWDHLLDRFERTGQRKRGLEVLHLKTGVTVPTGKKLLRNDEPDEKEKRSCPFEHLANGTYLFFEDGAGRFAHYFVNSQPLKALHDAVAKVKQLRNDVAHNEPTPALMDDAGRSMRDAQLWSTTDTFLSQTLVKAVLEELGELHPDQICFNLVSTVRARLRAVD
jgi:hypothetical protein